MTFDLNPKRIMQKILTLQRMRGPCGPQKCFHLVKKINKADDKSELFHVNMGSCVPIIAAGSSVEVLWGPHGPCIILSGLIPAGIVCYNHMHDIAFII